MWASVSAWCFATGAAQPWPKSNRDTHSSPVSLSVPAESDACDCSLPLGDDCSVFSHDLPSYIKDNFESARVTEANWETIQGGAIGSGCGQLAPYAHGDSLYFNGCQIRQAATKPLDLTRAR